MMGLLASSLHVVRAASVDLNLIARSSGIVVRVARIVDAIPHDTSSFTQGLLFHNGSLYESTGLYGKSSLKKLSPATGEVEDIASVPAGFFAEGIAIWKNRIIQLTWQEHTAFLYELGSLERTDLWAYDTEGWGITTDGEQFIMSDGSPTLQFRSTSDFTRTRNLTVTLGSARIPNINELEFARGKVYANMLGADHVFEIDPVGGQVTAVLDCQELRAEVGLDPMQFPLNGIAFDSVSGDFYLTGKLWPAIFRVVFDQELQGE